MNIKDDAIKTRIVVYQINTNEYIKAPSVISFYRVLLGITEPINHPTFPDM